MEGRTMKKLVVTTAYLLSDEEKENLKKQLFDTFGEASVEYHADEDIVGGIIVFDGNTVYDGSIKGKLKRAKDALKN